MQQQDSPQIVSATSLQGYCRADPEGMDDSFPTNSTLGPFDFFPGKYKVSPQAATEPRAI